MILFAKKDLSEEECMSFVHDYEHNNNDQLIVK
jgi:hypothetical protein